MSKLFRSSGLGRARNFGFMAALVALGTGCCPGDEGSTVQILGPDRVFAGQSVRYTVDGAGVGDSTRCPDVLLWHYEGSNENKPERTPPRTRQSANRCVINGETSDYTFPAGQPGTERQTTVSVELQSDVISDAEGQKTVTVVTPSTANVAQAGPFRFEDTQTFVAGTRPTALDAGQINGAGGIDLAVTDDQVAPDPDRLRTFLSTGASPNPFGDSPPVVDAERTFGATDQVPNDVVVGHFDEDTAAGDAAVVNNATAEVRIERNISANAGPAAQTFNVGSNPQSIARGDFNEDGFVDLVIGRAATGNNVTVIPNQPPVGSAPYNGFTSPTTHASGGDSPVGVTAGDVNGDDNLDIVTANSVSGHVTVLPGNGNGTFDPAESVVTPSATRFPHAVAVADFNADGQRDIAVANVQAPGTVGVLTNNMPNSTSFAGNFSETKYTAADGPVDLALGDFNSDGRVDIATANAGANNSSVFLATAGGTFSSAIQVSTGSSPFSVTVGDFNSDGRSDVATANSGSNTVTVAVASSTSGRSRSSATTARTTTRSRGDRVARSLTTSPKAQAMLAQRRRPRRRLQAVGRFRGGKLIRLGRTFYKPGGIGIVRGALLRARLSARFTGPRRLRRRVPRSVRRALNSNVVARVNGRRYPGADGLGPVAVKGALVARSSRNRRIFACMRVSLDGRPGRERFNRIRLVGGTGALRRLRMSGTFPPLDLDTASTRGRINVRVRRTRKRRGLTRTCRSLAKRLPKVRAKRKRK